MSVATLIFTLLVPVWARSFLSTKTGQTLSVEEVQQALQQAFSQTDVVEKEMQPLFEVMPKNEMHRLEPATARYALHRHFAAKYGWHVRGLEPSTSAINSSSGVEKNHVASFIQGLMEQQRYGKGLSLRDLAIVASTMSALIRSEMTNDFEDTFSTLGYSASASLDSSAVDDLLKFYLIKFVRGIHEHVNSSASYLTMEAEQVVGQISWLDMVMWLQDVRQAKDVFDVSFRNPFTGTVRYNRLVDMAVDVGHLFGSFQNMECTSLKAKLVDMEDEGTGRVPLLKFYSGVADDVDWPFIENTEYLRGLGALDETDPSNPTVVIPNYLGSRTHCVVPSSYYAVCCIDECEGLMAKVEQAVGEPVANPGKVAEVVAALSSDTVEAPRNLSSLQLTRLSDIAAKHGGRVPLHGRLFAQWMHHAYPRECRFPHESGTTVSLSQEEWLMEAGMDAEVSDEELQHVAEMLEYRTSQVSPESKAAALPWTIHEELVATHALHHKPTSFGRFAVLLLALVSATLPVARASMKRTCVDGKLVQHMV